MGKKISDDYNEEERIVWENLQKFRADAKLTHAQAAARSGLAEVTVRKIEKGTRNLPKSINLKRLVEAYGRDVGEVHRRENGPLDRTKVPMFALDVLDEEAVDEELLARARSQIEAWNREHAERPSRRHSSSKRS